MRKPLYKGHFAESQMYKSTTGIRPPLYNEQNFIPQLVATIEGFHSMLYTLSIIYGFIHW